MVPTRNFAQHIQTEAKTPSPDEINNLQRHLVPLYLFTLVWSVGATCDDKGRPTVNDRLWEIVKESAVQVGGTLDSSMFWYAYLCELAGEHEGQWTPWLTFALKYAVPPRCECQNFVMPTVHSLRLTPPFSPPLLEV